MAHVLPIKQNLACFAGRCCPPINRKTVVLPPPEAPMSAVTLPRGTCSDIAQDHRSP